MERSDLSSNVGKIKAEKWKYGSGFAASSENTAPFEASCTARNVYTCSFCKRRFKSAQALGGHMNVHRRERARLRMLPNPNPNPTTSMASSVLSLSTPFGAKNAPCNPSVMASIVHRSDKKKLIVFDFDHVTVDDNRIFKLFKTENTGVRLDLEMSLFKVSKDEDVDLELRLGYF